MNDRPVVRSTQSPAHLDRHVGQKIRWKGVRCRSRQSLLQRFTLEQLHGDETPSLVLVDVVDRADMGMLERRRGLRLALQALEGDRVGGELLRQDLQGDTEPELELFRRAA